MEKINRPPLSDIPTLKKLEDNWEQWGQELKEYQDSKGKKERAGQQFSWREGIAKDLRPALENLTDGHCSFCDGFPIGETVEPPIEHYHPKGDFPLQAYQWENLFYCCTDCNSEANRHKVFEFTLKPDEADYEFKSYFYFDLESGELLVYEHLERDKPEEYKRANSFLKRYGINSPKRKEIRKGLFNDVKNYFQNPYNPTDSRERKLWKYRYIYDFAERLHAAS